MFINDDVWFRPDALREHAAQPRRPRRAGGGGRATSSSRPRCRRTAFIEWYRPFGYEPIAAPGRSGGALPVPLVDEPVAAPRGAARAQPRVPRGLGQHRPRGHRARLPLDPGRLRRDLQPEGVGRALPPPRPRQRLPPAVLGRPGPARPRGADPRARPDRALRPVPLVEPPPGGGPRPGPQGAVQPVTVPPLQRRLAAPRPPQPPGRVDLLEDHAAPHRRRATWPSRRGRPIPVADPPGRGAPRRRRSRPRRRDRAAPRSSARPRTTTTSPAACRPCSPSSWWPSPPVSSARVVAQFGSKSLYVLGGAIVVAGVLYAHPRPRRAAAARRRRPGEPQPVPPRRRSTGRPRRTWPSPSAWWSARAGRHVRLARRPAGPQGDARPCWPSCSEPSRCGCCGRCS